MIAQDTVKDRHPGPDQRIGEIVIGVVQGRDVFARAEEEHRGACAVLPETAEILGAAQRQVCGAVADAKPGQGAAQTAAVSASSPDTSGKRCNARRQSVSSATSEFDSIMSDPESCLGKPRRN